MAMNIYTNEFIAGVIKGDLNANDVRRYCNNEPNLMALFKSLIYSANAMAQSKVSDCGGMFWNLTKRQFDFEKPSNMSLYTDSEFIRLQDAMGVVCDMMDEREHTLSETEDSIDDYIRYDNRGKREQIIKAIDELVRGKKGKDAAIIIAAAVSLRYIDRPPTRMLQSVFGIVGWKSGFDKYFRIYTESKDTKIQKELERSADMLKKIVEQ